MQRLLKDQGLEDAVGTLFKQSGQESCLNNMTPEQRIYGCTGISLGRPRQCCSNAAGAVNNQILEAGMNSECWKNRQVSVVKEDPKGSLVMSWRGRRGPDKPGPQYSSE